MWRNDSCLRASLLFNSSHLSAYKMKLIRKTSLSLLALALLFSVSVNSVGATAVKVITEPVQRTDTGIQVPFDVYDNTNALIGQYSVPLDMGTDITATTTERQINDAFINRFTSYAGTQGWTFSTSSDMYELGFNTVNIPEEENLKPVAFSGSYNDLVNLPTLPSALSFNNTASHSIVTTAGAANGWQISATRNASVFYSVNVNTTATIGGASDGYVVLEIAPTNSATSSDWKEVSRTRNGQTITLALALNSVQNIGSELMNVIPAGYYVRLRSVNVSGTPTYSYISGQEVQL